MQETQSSSLTNDARLSQQAERVPTPRRRLSLWPKLRLLPASIPAKCGVSGPPHAGTAQYRDVARRTAVARIIAHARFDP